mmetsp:Transcript_8275/g.18902  ORF Transcript_8275/g.18902 Transcript_8275/m.18902 type:complete len:319 (-) Transcript_8275:81-1037(-)
MSDHGSAAGTCVLPGRVADVPLSSVALWAVKCLYADEAMPRGPLVQWLLRLLLGIRVNSQQLQALLNEAPGVSMDPPRAKKFSFQAVLDVPPPGFTGFASEECIKEKLTGEEWQEVENSLARGGWPKAEEPSHKYYVVASWLQDVSDCLRAMSFGQVLGIVRGAAQTGGLLGHRASLLVPYKESEEFERKMNAFTGLPTHVAPDEPFVKSWEELKSGLTGLLTMQADAVLEVSKVKSLFRNVLHMELSETVFGYQCLSKLLDDPRLQDSFLLESVQGNRYTLRFNGPAPRTEKVRLSLADAVEPASDSVALPLYGMMW